MKSDKKYMVIKTLFWGQKSAPKQFRSLVLKDLAFETARDLAKEKRKALTGAFDDHKTIYELLEQTSCNLQLLGKGDDVLHSDPVATPAKPQPQKEFEAIG